MRNRLATVGIAFTLVWLTSCASLAPWDSRRDLFETGLTLFNQGRFAEAVPYLEDATHQNPEDGQAYFYLGRAYLSQSKWRQAISPLRSAFRLSPRDAQDEIVDLIIDAGFAAALNDFRLGDILDSPRPSKELL